MEKLIELLNEWNKEKLEEMENTFNFWTIDRAKFEYNEQEEYITYDGYQVNDYYIINKSTKFIERLVENNKIDIERLHKIVDYRLEIKENYVNAHDYNSNCLLMLLSIQDNPIEFLISVLK